MINPFDDTKEFITSNGEFTIHIDLIQGYKPEFGVVAVPVTGKVFFAQPIAWEGYSLEVYVGSRGRADVYPRFASNHGVKYRNAHEPQRVFIGQFQSEVQLYKKRSC